MTDTVKEHRSAAPTEDSSASRRDVNQVVNRNSPDFAALKVVHTRHVVRWIFGALVLFVVLQFLWSLATNDKYGWPIFATYFFAPAIIKGIQLTLALTVVSGTIGFVLGTLLALARLSKSPILNSVSWSFIWFFRSVPLLVQLLVWYNLGYLYPRLGLGVPFTDNYFWSFDTVTLVSQFAAAVLGLSLNQAAYSAEIIRGGILSVDQGQLEAAAALGLPRHVRVLRIILPQAARAILPNAFNEIIGLIKGTSIVSVIALGELFYVTQVIYNRNQQVIPLLLVSVVWYIIFTTVLSVAQFYVERHFARGALRVVPPTPIQAARGWVKTQWARLDEKPETPEAPTTRIGGNGS
ncbi:amino acid ABC transporter permease [Cryobacterium glucosi]|uniref:Amino acid ABC transporter permease n=1 Tax=Cryobacterium glucosi TaxID=1259175 RepID=A0ABY2IR56_9MICO|nr:amino acid ABC transporter permease [Cryobacterium glucosi]TFC21779.1 amino acid ABC transporter permease [Cryobacterium glucosi]